MIKPELFIWTEDTLEELRENREEQAWQDLKEGRCNHIEYTDRIVKLRMWVRQKLSELNK
jgi:hypothetical protein